MMESSIKNILITALLTLLSCSTTPSLPAVNRIRVSLSAEAGHPLNAAVYEEGKDGNAVTGSLVQVLDPGGSTTLLSFSTASGAYTGNPPALDGKYKVVVNSLAYGIKTNVLTYHPLSRQPEVLDISGSDGASAMTGAALSKSNTIAVSWNPVTQATVYQMRVIQSGSLVFQGTTSNTTYIIPAGTLSTGSLTLSIRAQYIGGDALFNSTNWYALSWCDSDSVFASIQ